MKQVIAMHGWSGDSTTWNLWAKTFQEKGWTWQSAERGYGDITETMPNWIQSKGRNTSHRKVIIGHSLGPHLIKNTIWEEATDAILLCSFSRFIPNGCDSRSLKTALKGMQKSIGTQNEKAMLNNFLKKASHPNTHKFSHSRFIEKGVSRTGRQKLEQDLRLLVESKNLSAVIPNTARVLIVQGAEDKIVIPAAKSYLREELQRTLLYKPTQITISGAGHFLAEPDLIHRISNWLDANS